MRILALATGLVFLAVPFLTAQTPQFELAFVKTVGWSGADLQWRYGSTGVSPRDMAFIDGRTLWVTQLGSAAVLDIRKNGELVRRVEFPHGRNFQLSESFRYLFGKGIAGAWNGVHVTFTPDMGQIAAVIELGYGSPIRFADTLPILVGNQFYYRTRTGSLLSISETGRIADEKQSIADLLTSWESTPFRDEATQGGNGS